MTFCPFSNFCRNKRGSKLPMCLLDLVRKIKVYWQVQFNFWQIYWSTTCKFSKRSNKTITPQRSTISVLSNSFKAINFYPASLHCLRGSASRAATAATAAAATAANAAATVAPPNACSQPQQWQIRQGSEIM